MKDIVISDFSSVTPQEHLSPKSYPEKWQTIAYKTTTVEGVLILARDGYTAPSVTLKLNIKGWHRIYVGLYSSAFRTEALSLKLTNDLGETYFNKGIPDATHCTWQAHEMIEEDFWEIADLTNQDVIIGKPLGSFYSLNGGPIGIAWLRFVPMTDEEVAVYKADCTRKDTRTLHGHTDMDFLSMTRTVDETLFSNMLHATAQSDIGLLSVEFMSLSADEYKHAEEIARGTLTDVRMRHLHGYREYAAKATDIYKQLLEIGHAQGMKLNAAFRMLLPHQLPPPYDATPLGHVDFGEKHPEFCCLDRDGERYDVLACTFPEVQDYIINAYLKQLEYGFDGATLFFHRGVPTLFEEPVLKAFEQEYPGIDPRTLPLDDERLVKIHCELMTGFIARMRKAFDEFAAKNHRERPLITPVVMYSIADNRRFGIDLQRWAEEKLIDNFVVANMCVWEEFQRFQDDQDPTRVSLEKYHNVKYHEDVSPIKRFHYQDLPRMQKNIPDYVALEKSTGVYAFIETPWENTETPEDIRKYALGLYDAGATHLSVWDTWPARMMKHDEWNITRRLGRVDEIRALPDNRSPYARFVRVLSLNNVSIASYHPAWRG